MFNTCICKTFQKLLQLSFCHRKSLNSNKLSFNISKFSLYPLNILCHGDLIIDEKDNVGVDKESTKKGQECSAWIMENDKTVKLIQITKYRWPKML